MLYNLVLFNYNSFKINYIIFLHVHTFLNLIINELVLSNHFSIYVPKIDLLGLEILTWHVMAWMNI